MQYVALVWADMALLFFCMLAMAVWGHRFGRRRVQNVNESATVGTGIVEGALFALLGLLIAFTFATSYSHFNVRRDLAVHEANNRHGVSEVGCAVRVEAARATSQVSGLQASKGQHMNVSMATKNGANCFNILAP
jgi:hypothetical protein